MLFWGVVFGRGKRVGGYIDLQDVHVVWFEETDHDIHVQKPLELADLIRDFEQMVQTR